MQLLPTSSVCLQALVLALQLWPRLSLFTVVPGCHSFSVGLWLRGWWPLVIWALEWKLCQWQKRHWLQCGAPTAATVPGFFASDLWSLVLGGESRSVAAVPVSETAPSCNSPSVSVWCQCGGCWAMVPGCYCSGMVTVPRLCWQWSLIALTH